MGKIRNIFTNSLQIKNIFDFLGYLALTLNNSYLETEGVLDIFL